MHIPRNIKINSLFLKPKIIQGGPNQVICLQIIPKVSLYQKNYYSYNLEI